MSFSVEPAALTSYARQLDRASADAGAVAGFVNTHATDATGGELIAIAAEGHRLPVAR
ncbi:hypothetical protein [Salinispora tropica]|uniref:hypothetical protein n=1 Tax=Salinispora tropica TaxID=168695 RepID=UPI000A56C0EF|nr:hypothetical protein [Salinispora tropica]